MRKILFLGLISPVYALGAPITQANCNGHFVQLGSSSMNIDGQALSPKKLPFGVITGREYLKPGIRAFSDGSGNYYRASWLLNRYGKKIVTILELNPNYGVPMESWICD